MKPLTFTVPGKPQPWQRTGSRKGGGRRTMDESKAYKRSVAGFGMVARKAWEAEHGPWPLDAYYVLDIATVTSNRRKLDLSNIRKNVEDALSGVLWFDDCRIWGESGGRTVDPDERVVVTVEIME